MEITPNIKAVYFNPLAELNPSAQRCLTRFFTADFASWTVHFVIICVKTQQIHQLFIQFINYIWYLLHVSALYCHPQGAFHTQIINGIICVFVGFSRIFLQGILIFKGHTAWRVYKPFGVKGLKLTSCFADLQAWFWIFTKITTNP
jgi:TctA family transporter